MGQEQFDLILNVKEIDAIINHLTSVKKELVAIREQKLKKKQTGEQGLVGELKKADFSKPPLWEF